MRTFDFPFCRLPLEPIGIAMYFVLVKLSHNSVLLINDPSKRGDMETLVRSSIFSSSQEKNEA